MRIRSVATAAILCGGLLCSTNARLVAAPLSQDNASVSTTATDRNTTQRIRKSIMEDKSLSTYAHNVKILVRDGKVTLRGPVRSEDEKKTVAQAASAVAGADNVVNELTVQPSK